MNLGLLAFTWNLPEASNMAAPVDRLFNFLVVFSTICFLGIVLGKIYFIFKYWRKYRPEHVTPYITGHTKMEAGVAFVLFVIVMVIFYWGWIDYKKMRDVPSDAYEINVIAKQWLWEFQYANGNLLTNELVVPLGKPVNLIMTSRDVLHSLYIPDFRVKQDVLPNAYTTLWFVPLLPGEFPLYCAEYCGTAHSKMLATVKVIEPEAFEQWEMEPQAAAPAPVTAPPGVPAVVPAAEAAVPVKTLAETGKDLFLAKGCTACHSVDGRAGIGPTVFNLFGATVELQDGTTVPADENYLRTSITDPRARIVKGYQPLMPTFKGQLTDEEMNALIAYIKSLK